MTRITALGRKEFPTTHAHKILFPHDETEMLTVWRFDETGVIAVEISRNTRGTIEFTPVGDLYVDADGNLKGKHNPIIVKKTDLSPDYVNAAALPSALPVLDEWTYLIECNRSEIKKALEKALKDSLDYSHMQYTVYIDSDGDVEIREDLTGSNWAPVRDDVRVIKVFNGDNWSWTDAFPVDECLKMVLDEATAEEKNAFEEWKSDHEYDDDTDASTLFDWWKDTAAAEKCKYESILAVADAYDYDLDVDQAIERLNW